MGVTKQEELEAARLEGVAPLDGDTEKTKKLTRYRQILKQEAKLAAEKEEIKKFFMESMEDDDVLVYTKDGVKVVSLAKVSRKTFDTKAATEALGEELIGKYTRVSETTRFTVAK